MLGFEVMNEPHAGYIGLKSLANFDMLTELHLGEAPNALDSFALGDGLAIDIPYYVKSWPWPSRHAETMTKNRELLSAWLPGKSCIWKKHGGSLSYK